MGHKRRARKSGSTRSGKAAATPARVSIVGAGAVGSTFALALFERGYRVSSIISRSVRSARKLAPFVGCRTVSTSVGDISPDTDVIILAVPDDSLELVVSQIAGTVVAQRGLVVHVSGVHSIDVLEPIRRRGTMTGSLHPVQSFPKAMSLRDRVRNLKGIWFGVEAKGAALERVRLLVMDLGGKEILIPAGRKPLYHAACVFASNYVVTLLNAVSEAFGAAGMKNRWKEVVLPLLTTSIGNALQSSPRQVLTGPVARGETRTVGLHLRALESFAPQLVPLYAVMGIDTARVARQVGRLTSDQFHSLVEGIRRSIRPDLNVQESKEER